MSGPRDSLAAARASASAAAPVRTFVRPGPLPAVVHARDSIGLGRLQPAGAAETRVAQRARQQRDQVVVGYRQPGRHGRVQGR